MLTRVFLGPSLPQRQARALLPDAQICAPARQGDIYDAAASGQVACICLIDGRFQAGPAVWHKEVLYALGRGVRVVGAASMGALRAAELHGHGMHGVGKIFRLFRDGKLSDDDEVAVFHAPAELDFAPCSVAMVSARHALACAVAARRLPAPLALAATAHLKSLYFGERDWNAVAAFLGRHGADVAPTMAFLQQSGFDLKRRDALAALRWVARAGGRARTPSAPATFAATGVWGRFVARRRPDGGMADDALLNGYCRLRHGGDQPLLHEAWTEVLEAALARLLGLSVTQAQRQAGIELLRRSHGLLQPQATRAWLDQRGLTRGQFDGWALALSRRKVLQSTMADELHRRLAILFRRRGQAAELAAAIDARRACPLPSAGEHAALAALTAVYASHFEGVPGGLRHHALRLGFADERSLFEALAREAHAAANLHTHSAH
ncbi:TfuA-like protein [Massilia sp. DWR3-1-1]|uniref:TfuA-like protein n=1 Tax=Massilia sp. DWR3-1-1 TaxID=2804559 RepID=UPI003CEF33D6